MILVILFLVFIAISLDTKAYKATPKGLVPFIAFVVFTVALMINTLNAGEFADKHNLDGSTVGWFAPNGVIITGVSMLVSLGLWVYVISSANKTKSKSRK